MNIEPLVEFLTNCAQITLRAVMRQQVVVVADTASTEMTNLISLRKKNLAEAGSEVGRLQAALNSVAHGVDWQKS